MVTALIPLEFLFKRRSASCQKFRNHSFVPCEVSASIFAVAVAAFDLYSIGYAFLAADTPGLLARMAEDLIKNENATLLTKSRFQGAEEKADGLYLPAQDLFARYLIGLMVPAHQWRSILALDETASSSLEWKWSFRAKTTLMSDFCMYS